MQVLHLSRSDSGGAGKAALRIHLGLKSLGVGSRMLVLSRSSKDPDVIELNANAWHKFAQRLFDHGADLMLRCHRTRRSRRMGYDYFSDVRARRDFHELGLVESVDVIHLHWIAGVAPYPQLFEILRTRPVVWTLHDLNPLTGGCHYPNGCMRFHDACGACPQLGSDRTEDLSRKIFLTKQRCYKTAQPHVVATSNWTAAFVKASGLLSQAPFRVIPYGVPADVFRPRDKQQSRRQFGIAQEHFIVLYASTIGLSRKGFQYGLEALNRLEVPGLALAIVGHAPDARAMAEIHRRARFPVYHLGHFRDEKRLSEAYSCADVFLMPSLEEAFGLVSLEAQSCAVPVVGFNIGGLADTVRHGESGMLVAPGDVQGLSDSLQRLASNHHLILNMGRQARSTVENRFTIAHQARDYGELYASICAR